VRLPCLACIAVRLAERSRVRREPARIEVRAERDLERLLLLRPALGTGKLLVVLRERLLVDRGAELRLDLLACLRLRLVVAVVELVRAGLVVTPR
jgi:hypothetical protein